MLLLQPYKAKQFFFVLIKLSIVGAAFYFVYRKLTNNSALKFSDFSDFVLKKDIFSLKTIIFLAFLSTLNWFFEILKWKILINPIKTTKLKAATEQILGSLTASLFTPNRIGEYGAKALYFVQENRKKAVLINVIGNLLQMAVTVCFGCLGLLFFIKIYQPNIEYQKFHLFLIIALAVIILIGLAIAKSSFAIKWFSFIKIRAFLKSYPKNRLALGMLLSFLRYAIFSFQFFFLLQLLNIQLRYFEAMVIISTLYFLASVIPSIFIFDVVVKGGVAIYLFTFAKVDSLAILSIVTLMWILNFVFPSIVGSYFILKFQPKTNPIAS
ncbi:lysylphosphatidylglycerol synthase domain-containing protein [Flavobacteriaceae bacterium GSB9]|nr:lysylphosphatidylglycerol synthase domain-containing protein [Flavobacteriaceae bacterium GSB9]